MELTKNNWDAVSAHEASALLADLWEFLTKLSKNSRLPENAREQIAKASLLCSEASYTVVGEDPATDGLFTEVRVAMEQADAKDTL